MSLTPIKIINRKWETVKVDKIDSRLAHDKARTYKNRSEKTKHPIGRVAIITEKEYQQELRKLQSIEKKK